MNTLEINAPDFRQVIDCIKLMQLPPARKRRFLSRQARMVVAQARKNVRDQKTVEGTPFVPRKDGTGRPMLRKLVKSKWLGVKVISDNEAMVYFYAKKIKDKVSGTEVWRNQGAVANKHQKGGPAAGWPAVRQIHYRKKLEGAVNLDRLDRQTVKTGAGYAGCSAYQAAMLLRLDYLPENLRGQVPAGKAGINFVRKNVHRALAARLIDTGVRRAGASQVPDQTPARPFLGANAQLRQVWAAALLRDLSGSFRAKNYQGLLK